MQRFNSPPGWPAPPTTDWQPPKGWQPDPTWPPAPSGWRFWVNERGGRSLGPQGLYGSVGRGRLAAAGAVGGVLVIAVLGALTGNSAGPNNAGPGVPGPTVTVGEPGATVTVRETVPGPTATVTQPPLPARTVTVRAPATTASVPSRLVGPTQTSKPRRTTQPPVEPPVETAYYPNCAAARAAGVAPLRRNDPGYGSHLDRDDDGIACE